uniref:Uncharacterized protein n=1 Tax=Trichogramma kaykai TaxID=54128 RepID=A0ABD2XLL9_9HYME
MSNSHHQQQSVSNHHHHHHHHHHQQLQQSTLFYLSFPVIDQLARSDASVTNVYSKIKFRKLRRSFSDCKDFL